MTYGVDQCRVCGAPIPVRPWGLRQQIRYGKKINSREVTLMTEPEWRAAGFRSQPTKIQMLFPSEGCCVDCGVRLEKRNARRTPLIATIGTVLAVLSIIAVVVLTNGFVATR